MVLQGARRTMLNTSVIHCEVEFHPIYLGQPLFGDVDSFLRDQGFVLIDLLAPARYCYQVPSGRTSRDRMIWSDAVYFRETDDAETLTVQSSIAASVYNKPTLAEHLMTRALSSNPPSNAQSAQAAS